MSAVFILLGSLTLASGVAAMTLRNPVHCALSVAVTFAGLAMLYLQLNAQFVGFAQILIYIGAVTILIVFAILLTRGSAPPTQPIFSSTWAIGAAIAAAVFAVLGGVIVSTRALPLVASAVPTATVKQLGDQLMTQYILPLEVLGLLLTAALIGAAIIAMPEKDHRAHAEMGRHPASSGNGDLGLEGTDRVAHESSSSSALHALSRGES
jgi:NADH-quinone oxidoreductase subunit J